MLNFINTAVAARRVVAGGRDDDGQPASAVATLAATSNLARPFTLVAPALGFISGALTAVGAAPREAVDRGAAGRRRSSARRWRRVLNAGNNALNQIYDLEIDRVNKPKRPLPSGALTIAQAWVLHRRHLRAGAGAGLAGRARRPARVLLDRRSSPSVCTYIYSVPPLRTKRHGIWANITIAIPRGVLLKVAGWSTVKTIVGLEPWYIGAIFGLFLLGASTTKDFADMEGDRARRLPDAADPLRRAARGLDDLAVLRAAVR